MDEVLGDLRTAAPTLGDNVLHSVDVLALQLVAALVAALLSLIAVVRMAEEATQAPTRRPKP